MTGDIHFITYGDDKFTNSKKRICKEASDFGVFKTIKETISLLVNDIQ